MLEIEVTVGSVADADTRDKLPYAAVAKIDKSASDEEKESAHTFNAMRKRLLEIGEMEQK